MIRLWRKLMRQCTNCGQKTKPIQVPQKRVAELNKRSGRLAKSLGRWPQVQICKKCGRMVMEGEPGFVLSLLLIDFDYTQAL